MEHLLPSTTPVHGRSPLPGQHGADLSSNDADPLLLTAQTPPSPHKSAAVPESEPSADPNKSCNRRRPEEEERPRPRGSMTNMSSSLIGKTVTPFLKEHIPSLYAPIGKRNNEQTAKEKNPNTKYCYRHRPDSKCRRAADEAKMVMIQRELDKLPPAVSAPRLLSPQRSRRRRY